MSDNALVLHEPLILCNATEQYLRSINSIPMLSTEEEFDLATQLYEHNNLKAAQKLIMAHLRFVVKIAKKYSGYGLPLEDMVQEGSIGLMKAVKRYQPTRMVRLATFALHWIKAEIQEYIIRNWKVVKIATTKAQRKLFYNLRKGRKKIGWMTQEERIMLSKELDVPIKDVYTMEQRLSSHDVNIYQPSQDVDDKSNSYQIEFDIQHEMNLEHDIIEYDLKDKANAVINNSLSTLKPRMRKIINDRYLSEEKSTLDDLAKEFSLSKERVRQLELQAINLIKNDCSRLIT